MLIHRAFSREVLHTCGAVSVILLGIFLVARLMGFLRQAVEGDIPANSVLLLLLLKTIAYLDLLAPLVLYVSTLLVMGRWLRDNELTVVSACGIGMVSFLKPAMALAGVVGALAALFSLYLSPLSAEASRALAEESQRRAEVAGIIAGEFGETRNGGVYFVESFDAGSGVFHNLFIHNAGTGGEGAAEVVVAETGRFLNGDGGGEETISNGDTLLLENGARYRATAGVAEYGALEFAAYGLRLRTPPDNGGRSLSIRATPTPALLAGESTAAAIGEFHWRLSKVAMLPILMVFALSFSSVTYRKNRFPGLLAALLVYFAYANALGAGVALIGRGAVHAHGTLWAVHLVFLTAAVCLLRRRNRNLPLLPRLPA